MEWEMIIGWEHNNDEWNIDYEWLHIWMINQMEYQLGWKHMDENM